MKKRVTILIGHSGSGKDTILKELIKHGMNGVVSYTTRAPRHYEKNGVDYHFVTSEQFKEMIEDGLLAEWTEYRNWSYGCAGEDLVHNSALIVEPKGLKQLREKAEKFGIELFVVYVCVDEEVRRERLEKRGDDPEEIDRRINSDRVLFKNISNYANYILVNNENDQKFLERKVRTILMPTIKHNLLM